MIRKYYIESLDNGVVITKYGRFSDYMNPSGNTINYSCDRLDDVLRLARVILGGNEEVRRGFVDMIVDVNTIEYLNKSGLCNEEDCECEE